MVSHGSNGKTRSELESILGGNIDTLGTSLKEYNTKIQKQDSVVVQVANSTWVHKDYKLIPQFSEIVQTNYFAEANPLEVGDEAKVNSWCADKTKQLITEVLAKGSIQNDTHLLLINAIYFKGIWQTQFEKEKTVEGPFHARTKELTLPIMSLPKGNFNYKRSARFEAVSLPYGQKDHSFAAVVVLPKDNDTLDELVENLDVNDIFFSNFDKMEGTMTLPRFQIEWGTESVLSSLKKLGMDIACSSGADFSLLTDPGNLAISDVLHKAVLKVNEEGSEAAAVAVVAMSRCLKPSFRMEVNRPFLFGIVDVVSKVVLFLGKIEEPTKL
jgi:serpin B